VAHRIHRRSHRQSRNTSCSVCSDRWHMQTPTMVYMFDYLCKKWQVSNILLFSQLILTIFDKLVIDKVLFGHTVATKHSVMQTVNITLQIVHIRWLETLKCMAWWDREMISTVDKWFSHTTTLHTFITFTILKHTDKGWSPKTEAPGLSQRKLLPRQKPKTEAADPETGSKAVC